MLGKFKITRKTNNKQSFFVVAKMALFFSVPVCIFLLGVFFLGEPDIIKAVEDTDTVQVSLDITPDITISDASDVVLDALSGMTGGTSTSSAISWTVVTNDVSGYTLTIEKNHLLYTGGGGANKQVADYTEASSGTPDYDWGAVGAGNEEFGFAPSSGSDWVQKFKNNTTACNVSGSITDSKCWSPIPTTASAETLASTSAGTGSSGSATAIKVQAQVGASNYLESGTYTSTITATAATK